MYIFAKKKPIDKLAIDIAKQIDKLYEILKAEKTDSTKKNRKFLLLRIKDQNVAKNCAIDNIPLFIQRINERTTTIGYELTTGWIIGEQDGTELESKIVVKIDNSDNIEIEYNNEIDIPQFVETLKEIEEIIKKKYKKQVKINYITKAQQSKTINELRNNDYIQINLFNKVKRVAVFSTGDNRFDENGNYKPNNFILNNKEIECLNWFINNVNIEDYKEEILKYCNNEYSMWSDVQITEQDIENEINIFAIAINITDNWKSKDGFIYISRNLFLWRL